MIPLCFAKMLSYIIVCLELILLLKEHLLCIVIIIGHKSQYAKDEIRYRMDAPCFYYNQEAVRLLRAN